MKTIIVLLLLLLIQTAEAQKTPFFRVYNAHGKKVARGNIFELSDSSVTLTRRNRFVETPLSQIDVIKANRTTGHRVMMTTLSVVGIGLLFVGTVYSLSTGRPGGGNFNPRPRKSRNNDVAPSHEKDRSPMEKPPKPIKKYEVNADAEKWQEQKKLLFYQRV